MEFIVLLIIVVIIYFILRFIFDVNIKKLKEIGEDKELDKLTQKYPENIEICKDYLKKLNNENVKIEEDKNSNATLYLVMSNKIFIANLKDRDCQNRETINIEGKWYVVTDSKQNINALEENGVFVRGTVKTNYSIDSVSFLRLFSECQGTFKGYFADVKYYRDNDGFIFPASYTYSEYQNAKSNKWWR